MFGPYTINHNTREYLYDDGVKKIHIANKINNYNIIKDKKNINKIKNKNRQTSCCLFL